MISLESTGYSAVYLDHIRTINEAYNTVASTPSNYHLKPHLFNFKPNPKPQVISSKTRKRKAENNISIETLDLKNTCNALIKELKENTHAFTSTTTLDTFERIWEEPTVFPQFKGVNATNQFQTFTLNNNKYIIPPGCQFFNHDLLNIKEISDCLVRFDFVVMDPPWKNKYIRRIKKAKPELGYKMMDNDLLSDIPLDELIHCDSIVAVWCTNSQQHQRALLEEFFPRWNLSLLHKVVWLKLNTEGSLIGEINNVGKKQPYEVLFIACHKDSQKDFRNSKKFEFLLSIPSIIHSHKPPILELLQGALPQNPKCLELFARYLQPGFTSIGLEVLKLMDIRLYSKADITS